MQPSRNTPYCSHSVSSPFAKLLKTWKVFLLFGVISGAVGLSSISSVKAWPVEGEGEAGLSRPASPTVGQDSRNPLGIAAGPGASNDTLLEAASGAAGPGANNNAALQAAMRQETVRQETMGQGGASNLSPFSGSPFSGSPFGNQGTPVSSIPTFTGTLAHLNETAAGSETTSLPLGYMVSADQVEVEEPISSTLTVKAFPVDPEEVHRVLPISSTIQKTGTVATPSTCGSSSSESPEWTLEERLQARKLLLAVLTSQQKGAKSDLDRVKSYLEVKLKQKESWVGALKKRIGAMSALQQEQQSLAQLAQQKEEVLKNLNSQIETHRKDAEELEQQINALQQQQIGRGIQELQRRLSTLPIFPKTMTPSAPPVASSLGQLKGSPSLKPSGSEDGNTSEEGLSRGSDTGTPQKAVGDLTNKSLPVSRDQLPWEQRDIQDQQLLENLKSGIEDINLPTRFFQSQDQVELVNSNVTPELQKVILQLWSELPKAPDQDTWINWENKLTQAFLLLEVYGNEADVAFLNSQGISDLGPIEESLKEVRAGRGQTEKDKAFVAHYITPALVEQIKYLRSNWEENFNPRREGAIVDPAVCEKVLIKMTKRWFLLQKYADVTAIETLRQEGIEDMTPMEILLQGIPPRHLQTSEEQTYVDTYVTCVLLKEIELVRKERREVIYPREQRMEAFEEVKKLDLISPAEDKEQTVLWQWSTFNVAQRWNILQKYANRRQLFRYFEEVRFPWSEYLREKMEQGEDPFKPLMDDMINHDMDVYSKDDKDLLYKNPFFIGRVRWSSLITREERTQFTKERPFYFDKQYWFEGFKNREGKWVKLDNFWLTLDRLTRITCRLKAFEELGNQKKIAEYSRYIDLNRKGLSQDFLKLEKGLKETLEAKESSLWNRYYALEKEIEVCETRRIAAQDNLERVIDQERRGKAVPGEKEDAEHELQRLQKKLDSLRAERDKTNNSIKIDNHLLYILGWENK